MASHHFHHHDSFVAARRGVQAVERIDHHFPTRSMFARFIVLQNSSFDANRVRMIPLLAPHLVRGLAQVEQLDPAVTILDQGRAVLHPIAAVVVAHLAETPD
jgi:hypothetical protein